MKKFCYASTSLKMYKDAARLKVYKQTGEFSMVTKSISLSSLAEVLSEDAKFLTTKQKLISKQEWKLIDLTRDKRVRASVLLEKLPDRTFRSLDDVIAEFSRKFKGSQTM